MKRCVKYTVILKAYVAATHWLRTATQRLRTDYAQATRRLQAKN